jgi:hypothetical protein
VWVRRCGGSGVVAGLADLAGLAELAGLAGLAGLVRRLSWAGGLGEWWEIGLSGRNVP